MKGVADRTLELLNEFQKVQFTKSYRDFQHFLVVKIEQLEDEVEALREIATDAQWCAAGHMDEWADKELDRRINALSRRVNDA